MAAEAALFSRERLAGYDPELMARSVALVVGAGALGQNAAQNLALAGVGEIRIVDKDQFEEHNRTRSPAYPLPDEQERLGTSKARAVALKLRRMMTAPRPVMRYAESWIQELGDGAFKGASVVLSCVDRASARAYLSDRSRLHGLPLVEGGFEAAEVTLSCYPAVRGDEALLTPCWRCSHQQAEEQEGAFSCRRYAERAEQEGFIPAIQNAAAILGGLQAEAAILALHGPHPTPLAARAFDLNIRTGRARVVKLAPDPLCPGNHRALEGPSAGLETGAGDSLAELLRELGQHFPGPPTVELKSPLIWSIPCTGCKAWAAVRRPDWVWLSAPRCADCGGPFPREARRAEAGPRVYCRLTHGLNPEVLQLTCEQAGLLPLSLVEATAPGSPSKVFELAGSVEHYYKSGDTYGEQQD
jgi:molybdopterin/thiamine biosynthesis adenylyltransferase